jgi:hypothetical protein
MYELGENESLRTAVSDVAIVPALDGGWAFGVIVTGMRVTKYRISTDIRREFFNVASQKRGTLYFRPPKYKYEKFD